MKARVFSFVAALVTVCASSVGAQTLINVPSGQAIELFETRLDEEANVMRLRFIAPDLSSPLKRPSFEDIGADLEALCMQFGLQSVLNGTVQADQIVVSLSAEPVEFGVSNSDVEQVFEAFSVENETCMLEMF